MYSTLMLHVQDQTLVLTFWRTVVHLSDIAVQLRHADQLIVPQPYVYSDFCACPFIVDVSCVLELASYIYLQAYVDLRLLALKQCYI